jgi:hypothetical protein
MKRVLMMVCLMLCLCVAMAPSCTPAINATKAIPKVLKKQPVPVKKQPTYNGGGRTYGPWQNGNQREEEERQRQYQQYPQYNQYPNNSYGY